MAGGATAENQGAPGAEQAYREVDAERRRPAVENNVDAPVEHREAACGGPHEPGLHVLGGFLEHLLGGSVPDAVGADRPDRHEGGVRVSVEGGALAVTPAHARAG